MKRFTAVSVVTRRAALERAVRGRTLQQPLVAESTKLRFRKAQEAMLGRGVGCVTDAAVRKRHGAMNVARGLAKGGVTGVTVRLVKSPWTRGGIARARDSDQVRRGQLSDRYGSGRRSGP